MISHKHKFLSIRIPKTASTSVTTVLKPYFDIQGTDDRETAYYFHAKAELVKDHFDSENWNFNSYFKFAFVRNPFERQVSLWEYAKKVVIDYLENTDADKILNDANFKDKMQIIKYENFQNWVIKSKEHFNQRPLPDGWTPQCRYICKDWDKALLVDFIGKTENIQQDFNTICDKIGIQKQKLPHKNASNHRHYTEYYNEETRQIVENHYAKDLEYFGYEFGE